MSDFEYRILCYIHRRGCPVPWVDVLNAFRPFSDPVEVDSVLTALLSSGTLRKTSTNPDPHFCSVVLSDSAVLSLIHEETHRIEIIQEKQYHQQQAAAKAARASKNRRAERKSDHEFQKKLSRWNLLIGFLLGLLADHFEELVAFLASMFK